MLRSIGVWEFRGVSPEEEKGLTKVGFAEKEGFKPGIKGRKNRPYSCD